MKALKLAILYLLLLPVFLVTTLFVVWPAVPLAVLFTPADACRFPWPFLWLETTDNPVDGSNTWILSHRRRFWRRVLWHWRNRCYRFCVMVLGSVDRELPCFQRSWAWCPWFQLEVQIGWYRTTYNVYEACHRIGRVPCWRYTLDINPFRSRR